MFEKYVSETLIPTYDIFNTNQSGTMYSMDDEWLNLAGIMAVTILDFDLDGKAEMLVCHTEQIRNTDFQINMDMYEVVDGKVTLTSSKPFCAYYDNQKNGAWNAGITLSKNEWADIVFSVNATNTNGGYCIVCETCKFNASLIAYGESLAKLKQ